MVTRPNTGTWPLASSRYTVTPNVASSRSAEMLSDAEVESVLQEMRRNRDPRTPLLKEWLRHSDERVVIAALRYERYSTSIQPFVKEVTERALEAVHLGYLWTPLLDTVATRAHRFDYGVFTLLLERLMGRIAQHGSADDVRRMLSNFDSAPFLGAAARHCPYLTVDMAWRLLRRNLDVLLANNPFASDEVLDAAVNHLIDERILGRRGTRYGDMESRGSAVTRLEELVRAGCTIQANRVAKLAERLPGLRRVMYDDAFGRLEELVRRSLRDTVGEMTGRQRQAVATLFLNSNSERRLDFIASL